jgi:hypothetical protein
MRWLVAAAFLLAACKSDAPPPAGTFNNRPAKLGDAERKRGDDACHAYVDRLCKCAAAKPTSKDLGDRCQLKHAKLEALAMALSVDDDPSATAQDVYDAQDGARKIIAKCIEENVALDQECP